MREMFHPAQVVPGRFDLPRKSTDSSGRKKSAGKVSGDNQNDVGSDDDAQIREMEHLLAEIG